MTLNRTKIFGWLFLLVCGAYFAACISSCGKQGTATAATSNIQYQVLNLSPDLFPVNLYIDIKPVNTYPFSFAVGHGYFYLPSTDTPFQFRTALVSGAPLFNRDDILNSGGKYTLFITGQAGDRSLTQIFTVDTASSPATGRGKVRLVNVSPTATGGVDVYANGTLALKKIVYKNISKYIELPAGNYDFQFTNTGSTDIIKDIPLVTIQDGRLYTLFAYGYSSRADSAAFNVGELINK